MAIAEQTPPLASVAQVKRPSWIAANWGLLLATAALIGVLLLPTPESLPLAGHRMLAILVFAVIVWMTEALDYAVSGDRHCRPDGVPAGLFAQSGKSEGPDGHERRPDARVQRLCQYRAGAGRLGAVSRRRDDGDRARQAHRAQHPVARRDRDAATS